MKFKPLGDRVLVKRTDEEQTTEGGIVLPGSAAEQPSEGKVLAVGPGKTMDNGEVRAVSVKEGDLVVEGDTLCIIEAMKIMNNIEAEHSGRIIKILVENGKSVEYNQPLFEIKPS